MNKWTFLSLLFGHKFKCVVALCASLTVIALLPFTSLTSAPQASSQPAAALTVTVAAAAMSRWPTRLEASGAVMPWEEAVIGSQVANLRLVEILVNVGDRVKRGQLLATFDADLLRADESRLKASWQQADANRKRAQQLKGTGGISDQDVLQYETQADMAKALLIGTQLQLRYAKVTALDDGVISARSATVGAVYGNGQELFRIIRQSRLEWRGELNAAQLAQVKHGQSVILELPDGTSATAVVRELAPSLDSQTRLGIAYADIDSSRSARAGMYARGRIDLSDSSAVVVPAVSVVIRDGRSYVPVMLDDNRVTLQPVTVGRRQDHEVEIVSGIHVGQTVIVQGAGFLNEGDRVHIGKSPVTAKE
ncbi:efflux RND transporter periplasmic adaptor subunit [Pseudomonas sp. MAFF 301449]|uniref:Efflux RND transporter periplasmic adaptor subunit n=1 Tax=Pseudomonas cyclaminis TaxID=2781239 RepID=A0ABR9SRP0_9PSED|nr:efflux RND transporter periplasmic adaptor subunit [Pseudomonas cyclaminis]MBE8591563.1 efflux RND transporter periplasmic adaptor subunit [Pseudomonas cyclaminis]MBE8598652.1 efflux RND transporter periplasmic adaptor subunit [Pseudomonas cyclaminis]